MLCVLVYIFSLSNKSYEEELWIAKAGVVSIVVFAMFSYPTQILPIKICIVLYAAYIATMATRKKTISLQRKKCIRVAFGALMVGIVFTGAKVLPSYYMAWKSWSVADRLAKIKNYTASIEEDKKAWPLLKYDGNFLIHYGKVLTLAGEYKQAINVLNRAILYSPNTIVYTTLGDACGALGEIEEAEQAYLKAWYMNPSRFYPKYLLAKLYDESGQIEKAVAIAEELLNKEVKVESTAVEEMQTEMKDILSRNKQREIACP
jgi:tetratricopeptide (TPR) repeat protein